MNEDARAYALYLTGLIDSECLERLAPIIKRGEPCLLMVDCGGGSVDIGETLSALISDNGNVTCLVTDRSHSMANHVVQACRKRFAFPRSTFLFHSITVHPDIKAMDMWNDSKVEIFREELKLDQLRYWKRILRRVGGLTVRPELALTEDVLRDLCEREVRLTAAEALQYGLLDGIKSIGDILSAQFLSELGFDS